MDLHWLKMSPREPANVTIISSYTVRILQPQNLTYSEAMSRYCNWLDAHQIEPVLFTLGVQTDGRIALEIAFQCGQDATLFQSATPF